MEDDLEVQGTPKVAMEHDLEVNELTSRGQLG